MVALRLLRPAARHALRHLHIHPHTKPPVFQYRTCATIPDREAPTSKLTHSPSPRSSPEIPHVQQPSKFTHSKAKGLRLRLDVESSSLIDAHREALRAVLAAIRNVPEASNGDVRLLEAEIHRLGDGFFMLVVAGEYNAGKSSLINALVGMDVLAVGATPTTSAVTKLKYTEESEKGFVGEDGVVVVGEPVEVLANRLQIVDTPGTNAIDRGHEKLTREFLPLCDIVLFVTSADRPFSESERLFLEGIRKWGKKVVMVINKMDLLEEGASEEVVEFVSGSAKALLGSEPKVFALSSRYARMAREDRDSVRHDMQWEASGLGPLEDYINRSLDSLQRLRLKLRASASVGKTLANKYIGVLESNKEVVDADIENIRKVDSLLRCHEEMVRKGYPGHFARADNVLLEILDRADIFFDAHIRMSNLWNLSNRAVVEQAFEDEVVKGTAKAVQRQIQGLGEWLSDASSRNLAETTAIFSRRVGERAREISAMHKDQETSVNSSSLSFSGFPAGRDIEVMGGRERFVTRLSEVSDDLSSDYVSRREGRQIADKITNSIRLSAGLGIGSVGSMLLFLMNSTSLAPAVLFGDPTIPVVASVLGALGLVTMPRQRMALRAELRARVVSTRTRLRNELSSRVEEQLTAHVCGIREAIQPFADFSEDKGREIRERLALVEGSLQTVRKLDDKLKAVDSVEEELDKR